MTITSMDVRVSNDESVTRVNGPITTDRFSGYDTDIWFVDPNGAWYPKHVVVRLNTNS